MNRQEILTIVIESLKDNVDELEEQEIDPSKSLAEYGASSLDNVEIVSSILRRLKLRVPRADMANLSNIDGLVDLLHTRVSAA